MNGGWNTFYKLTFLPICEVIPFLIIRMGFNINIAKKREGLGSISHMSQMNMKLMMTLKQFEVN